MRKRVIKLLKTFYGVTEDTARQIDICSKLVVRMLDEDETVKVREYSDIRAVLSFEQELAVKTLEELWFGAETLSSEQVDDKSRIMHKAHVIMGVTGMFRDRLSPLEDMVHKVRLC